MTPAMQARPAPSAQAKRMTRRTSTPTTPASAGFSLTARMERPMVVRVRTRWTRTTRSDGDGERQELVGGGAQAVPEADGDLELAS